MNMEFLNILNDLENRRWR